MEYPDGIAEAASIFALLTILVISTVSDLTEHRIPNALLLPGLIVAVLLGAAAGGIVGLGSAIGGLAVGLGILMPLYLMGGMGAGDVKLMGVIGAFLGPSSALVAGAMTLVFGGIIGLLFMGWRLIKPALEHYTGLLLELSSETPFSGRATALTKASGTGSGFAYAPALAMGALFALWHGGSFSRITFG